MDENIIRNHVAIINELAPNYENLTEYDKKILGEALLAEKLMYESQNDYVDYSDNESYDYDW